MDQALRMQVERQLSRVAFDYDARRIQAEIALHLGLLKRYRDAFNLLQAMPYWVESGSWDQEGFQRPQLVFEFSCQQQIVPLLAVYRTIAKIANGWEVPRVILTWVGAMWERSYQIIASMGDGDDIFEIPPPLDLSVSISDTMKIGELIRGSEYPMGLVINKDDWQVWCNQPLSVMCQKPIEELIRMNVRGNWVDRNKRTDDGLASVKSRLKVDPTGFNLRYTTKVSPDAIGKHHFHSNFRLVLGGRCRLTTIYDYQPAV